jgi:ferrochelatase
VTPRSGKKVAVVLFNLGGPDSLKDVKPFLFNLFRDPAIIDLPTVARLPLATLISATRAPTARANYALMGGASPLLRETAAQALALDGMLTIKAPQLEARCFIAMRYWRPFAEQAARDVAAYAPDEIVLLPLYPQYSTTTSASSLSAWREVYAGPGRVRTICCHPTQTGFVGAYVAAIRKAWLDAGASKNVRLLFSAHGLPQRVVAAGDPYRAQVEATAAAIAAGLPELSDWRVCYQSRVGRLPWLEPYTDAEIRRAGADRKGVVIAPIAFVSEHVETLIELDRDYRRLADDVGCAPYLRAATPGVDAAFIEGLAQLVLDSLERPGGSAPGGPWRCPAGHAKCALKIEEGASR